TSTATDMERMLKYKDFFGFMLQEALYPDQELKQRISKTDRSIAKDYGIEELENQIENSKSEKVQNISNQPNAPSQELLNLDNHNQESTLDEPRSKNATSSPSLSIEEEFTRETLSFNKNKIKCTIWDIPNETLQRELGKVLVFMKKRPYRAQWQMEKYSEDLERYLKNRPSINLLHESNLEELHELLKKGAPNNIRSNKFDKNSASVILKKDVISLSKIYKSLKCQYKTTKAASLSENIVADFNHQWFILNKRWAAEIEKEKTKRIEDLSVKQYKQRILSVDGPEEKQISNDWKDIYSPIEWINKDWYKSLDQEISDME
ncbi:323_t:CDS:2, partial [Gigaspora margarita]